MAFTRNDRMISFRITEDLFQELVTRSKNGNYKSVSEYCRHVLDRDLATPDADQDIYDDQQLTKLADRLASKLEDGRLSTKVAEKLLPKLLNGLRAKPDER